MSRGVPGSARCGTPSGYKAHLRRGEHPCDRCTAAWNTDQQQLRASNPNVREARRRYARAHARAVSRLKNRYAADFRTFLDQELSREEAPA